MTKHNRAIAFFTLLFFLWEQFVFSAPDLFSQANAFAAHSTQEVKIERPFEFSLPPELGTIQALHSGTGPAVIHIQTAHGNYEAQKKIQSILHDLKNRYGIKTIFVEGSAAELDAKLLEFVPDDPGINMQVADRLTKKAIVKGVELFLLEDAQAHAYGIEDLKSYVSNGQAFLKVLNQKEKIQKLLTALDQRIRVLSGAALNKDLRAFLNKQDEYEVKKVMSLDAWLNYLRDQAREVLKVDLTDARYQLDWPMIFRILKLKDFEKRMDPSQYKKEKDRFWGLLKGGENISKDDFDRIYELLAAPLSEHQLPDPETGLLFERMMRSLSKDFDFKDYPNLKIFIGHLILQSELKGALLFGEINRLTEKTETNLAKTPKEKEVLSLLRDYQLLQKLFELELIPEDYEKVLARKAEITPSNFIVREKLANDSITGKEIAPHGIEAMDLLFAKALEFYQWAKRRDSKMLTKIEQRLNGLGQTPVIVITGGFHAEPFKEYFQNKNRNYALIAPRIENLEGKEAYEEASRKKGFHFLETSTLEDALVSDPTLIRTPELRSEIRSEVAAQRQLIRSEFRNLDRREFLGASAAALWRLLASDAPVWSADMQKGPVSLFFNLHGDGADFKKVEPALQEYIDKEIGTNGREVTFFLENVFDLDLGLEAVLDLARQKNRLQEIFRGKIDVKRQSLKEAVRIFKAELLSREEYYRKYEKEFTEYLIEETKTLEDSYNQQDQLVGKAQKIISREHSFGSHADAMIMFQYKNSQKYGSKIRVVSEGLESFFDWYQLKIKLAAYYQTGTHLKDLFSEDSVNESISEMASSPDYGKKKVSEVISGARKLADEYWALEDKREEAFFRRIESYFGEKSLAVLRGTMHAAPLPQAFKTKYPALQLSLWSEGMKQDLNALGAEEKQAIFDRITLGTMKGIELHMRKHLGEKISEDENLRYAGLDILSHALGFARSNSNEKFPEITPVIHKRVKDGNLDLGEILRKMRVSYLLRKKLFQGDGTEEDDLTTGFMAIYDAFLQAGLLTKEEAASVLKADDWKAVEAWNDASQHVGTYHIKKWAYRLGVPLASAGVLWFGYKIYRGWRKGENPPATDTRSPTHPKSPKSQKSSRRKRSELRHSNIFEIQYFLKSATVQNKRDLADQLAMTAEKAVKRSGLSKLYITSADWWNWYFSTREAGGEAIIQDSFLLLVGDTSNVDGFVYGYRFDDKTAEVGFVGTSEPGTGLGTKLADEALVMLREEGMEKIKWEAVAASMDFWHGYMEKLKSNRFQIEEFKREGKPSTFVLTFAQARPEMRSELSLETLKALAKDKGFGNENVWKAGRTGSFVVDPQEYNSRSKFKLKLLKQGIEQGFEKKYKAKFISVRDGAKPSFHLEIFLKDKIKTRAELRALRVQSRRSKVVWGKSEFAAKMSRVIQNSEANLVIVDGDTGIGKSTLFAKDTFQMKSPYQVFALDHYGIANIDGPGLKDLKRLISDIRDAWADQKIVIVEGYRAFSWFSEESFLGPSLNIRVRRGQKKSLNDPAADDELIQSKEYLKTYPDKDIDMLIDTTDLQKIGISFHEEMEWLRNPNPGTPEERAITKAVSFFIVENFLRKNSMSNLDTAPYFVVDGPSGIGKTTLMRAMQKLLKRSGYKAVYLNLDMFLIERAKRYQIINDVLDGKIKAAELDEMTFFDMKKIQEMLEKINAFRRSGKPSFKLVIPNAYDPSRKTYRNMQFTITRETVVIVEGKYAHAEELDPFYGDKPFRVRIAKDFNLIREQIEEREGPYRSEEEMRRYMKFYDQILVPSYERYASRSVDGLHVLSFRSPEEDYLDRSELRAEVNITEETLQNLENEMSMRRLDKSAYRMADIIVSQARKRNPDLLDQHPLLILGDSSLPPLTLGGRELIVSFMSRLLKRGRDPKKISKWLRKKLIPSISVLESITGRAMDLHHVGAETHEGLRYRGNAQLKKAKFVNSLRPFTFKQTSIKASGEYSGNFELNPYPSTYFVFTLLLKTWEKMHILDIRQSYHQSVDASLGNEALRFFIPSFFVGYPKELRVSLPLLSGEGEMGYPGLANLDEGFTVNPISGEIEGKQTNWYQRPLGLKTDDGEIFRLYPQDIERNFFLIQGASLYQHASLTVFEKAAFLIVGLNMVSFFINFVRGFWSIATLAAISTLLLGLSGARHVIKKIFSMRALPAGDMISRRYAQFARDLNRFYKSKLQLTKKEIRYVTGAAYEGSDHPYPDTAIHERIRFLKEKGIAVHEAELETLFASYVTDVRNILYPPGSLRAKLIHDLEQRLLKVEDLFPLLQNQANEGNPEAKEILEKALGQQLKIASSSERSEFRTSSDEDVTASKFQSGRLELRREAYASRTGNQFGTGRSEFRQEKADLKWRDFNGRPMLVLAGSHGYGGNPSMLEKLQKEVIPQIQNPAEWVFLIEGSDWKDKFYDNSPEIRAAKEFAEAHQIPIENPIVPLHVPFVMETAAGQFPDPAKALLDIVAMDALVSLSQDFKDETVVWDRNFVAEHFGKYDQYPNVDSEALITRILELEALSEENIDAVWNQFKSYFAARENISNAASHQYLLERFKTPELQNKKYAFLMIGESHLNAVKPEGQVLELLNSPAIERIIKIFERYKKNRAERSELRSFEMEWDGNSETAHWFGGDDPDPDVARWEIAMRTRKVLGSPQVENEREELKWENVRSVFKREFPTRLKHALSIWAEAGVNDSTKLFVLDSSMYGVSETVIKPSDLQTGNFQVPNWNASNQYIAKSNPGSLWGWKDFVTPGSELYISYPDPLFSSNGKWKVELSRLGQKNDFYKKDHRTELTGNLDVRAGDLKTQLGIPGLQRDLTGYTISVAITSEGKVGIIQVSRDWKEKNFWSGELKTEKNRLTISGDWQLVENLERPVGLIAVGENFHTLDWRRATEKNLNPKENLVRLPERSELREIVARNENALVVTEEMEKIFYGPREKILPIRFMALDKKQLVKILEALLGEPVYSETAGISHSVPLSIFNRAFGENPIIPVSRYSHWFDSTASVEGRVLLDPSLLKLVATKNPKTLFVLFQAMKNFQEKGQLNEPLLAVTGEKSLIFAEIKKGFEKAGNGLSAELKHKAFKLFFEKDFYGLNQLVKVMAPSEVRLYIEEHNNGVVNLVSGQENPSGTFPGMQFFLNLNEIDSEDFLAVAFVVPSLLKVARHISGVHDSALQQSELLRQIQDLLPGTQSMGNRGFKIRLTSFIQEVLIRQRLVEASA